MSGFRVQVDLHHNPGDEDGRVFMFVFNGWQVWRLTEDETRQLSADMLLKLAEARDNDSQPIDAGHPNVWSLSGTEPF